MFGHSKAVSPSFDSSNTLPPFDSLSQREYVNPRSNLAQSTTPQHFPPAFFSSLSLSLSLSQEQTVEPNKDPYKTILQDISTCIFSLLQQKPFSCIYSLLFLPKGFGLKPSNNINLSLSLPLSSWVHFKVQNKNPVQKVDHIKQKY